MKKIAFYILFFLSFFAFCNTMLFADTPKKTISVTLLPFSVHSSKQYVADIPTLLQTRINGDPIVVTRSQNATTQEKILTTDNTVQYVIHGTCTEIGTKFSIDVVVIGRDNFVQTFTAETTEATFLQDINALAQKIRVVLLEREKEKAIHKEKQTNTNIAWDVSNTTTPNSQTAWFKTESFELEPKGIAVGDLDTDGIPEIVVLGADTIRVFHWNGGNIQQVAHYTFPPRIEAISVAIADIGIGKPALLVSAFLDVRSPYSAIFTYSKNKLTVRKKAINYMLNAYYDAAQNKNIPILQYVTQYPAPIFASPVRTWQMKKDVIVPGKELELPAGANVFNFTTILTHNATPAFLMYNGMEAVQYFTNLKRPAYTTGDRYSGSMNFIPLVPEFIMVRNAKEQEYAYIPLPMLHFSANNKQFVILSYPKNRSAFVTTFRSFVGYKMRGLYFAEGEEKIVWESPLVEQSVYGGALYDIDGDGTMNLIVLSGKPYVNALTAAKKYAYLLSIALN